MQRRGIRRQITDKHRCCGAGNANHVVMFRQPIAVIAAFFSQASEIQRVREGRFGARTLGDRCQIEHRERNRFVSHKGSLCYSIVIRLKVFFQPGAFSERQPEKLQLSYCMKRRSMLLTKRAIFRTAVPARPVVSSNRYSHCWRSAAAARRRFHWRGKHRA